MVRLPGGVFQMGCVPGDAECAANEKPRHSVTLAPFRLDRHEVTVTEYRACVQAGVCPEPPAADADLFTDYYTWSATDRDDYPLNGVSWDDAQAYCAWRGKRLPTEAEFEFALRGGRADAVYPWGDEKTPPPAYGNYPDQTAGRLYNQWTIFEDYDDGYPGPAPVCRFAENPYGLCDISGNLWEWCRDGYGARWYAATPPMNPCNDNEHWLRVLRGGSYFHPPYNARASYRFRYTHDYRDHNIGFRCAADTGS